MEENKEKTTTDALREATKVIIKDLAEQTANKTINDRDRDFFTDIQMFIARLKAKELDEYKELPFKIGDEAMVDYTNVKTGELKSIKSKIHDIICVLNPFTYEPCISVIARNDEKGDMYKIKNWKTDIHVV